MGRRAFAFSPFFVQPSKMTLNKAHTPGKMKNALFAAVFCAAVLAVQNSCSHGDEFSISGEMKGCEGKKLILVREGLNGAEVTDSAEVNKKGKFILRGKRPASPEIYTLRNGSHLFFFPVDSTEKIVISTADTSLTQVEVSGSEKAVDMQKWREFALETNKALRTVVDSVAKSGTWQRGRLNEQMYGIIKNYKDTAAAYISRHSESIVSYYLLFKKLAYDINPFDVNAAEDYRSFAIVANKWNKLYPDAGRTIHIRKMMESVKESRQRLQMVAQANSSGKAGFINLSYPDRDGKMHNLSDLKGKYILLQFCYLSQLSAQVKEDFRKVYRELNPRGLEIYMVTFDKDFNRWAELTLDFPFTVVRDINETSAATYNFSLLPTNYLIDPEGNIVGRDLTMKQLMARMAK